MILVPLVALSAANKFRRAFGAVKSLPLGVAPHTRFIAVQSFGNAFSPDYQDHVATKHC